VTMSDRYPGRGTSVGLVVLINGILNVLESMGSRHWRAG
jgi:hypothetical protein